MRAIASYVQRVVRRAMCAAGHHRYVAVQELTHHSRRIACPHCRRSWGMNDDVRAVLAWDYELASCYAVMGVELHYLPWERFQPNNVISEQEQ